MKVFLYQIDLILSLIDYDAQLLGYYMQALLQACLLTNSGLEITAGQWTMSGLIVDLTGQTFVLPVMLTGQNSIVLKMK